MSLNLVEKGKALKNLIIWKVLRWLFTIKGFVEKVGVPKSRTNGSSNVIERVVQGPGTILLNYNIISNLFMCEIMLEKTLKTIFYEFTNAEDLVSD